MFDRLTRALGLRQGREKMTFRPWPNDQTLFVKHFKFGCKIKHLAFRDVTKHCSSNIFCLPRFFACIEQQRFWAFSKILKKILLVKQCLWRNQTLKHCLISKFQMFGKQCLIFLPGPNRYKIGLHQAKKRSLRRS